MAAEKEKLARLAEAQKFCRLNLMTIPGAKILEYLMMYCGVLVRNRERDPQLMAFREGQRDVALHLMELLGYAPIDRVATDKGGESDAGRVGTE